MATQKVELMRVAPAGEVTRRLASIVHAATKCRRVVTATWDGKEVVLSVTVPAPKAVVAAAKVNQ